MNWIKSYFPTVLISILILMVMEVSLRLTFDDFPASIRSGYTKKIITDIYGASDADDYQIVLAEHFQGWEYHPFVEHKESSRGGKFVSVSKNNIRCNSNGTSNCVLSHGNNVIWVFGGSTVFGYGVKNDETIPAYLEKLMPGHKVINMGHASYYSTPERILFSEHLASGQYPEIAIFIDGLNDFFSYQVPDQSVVSQHIQLLVSGCVRCAIFNPVKEFLKKSYLVAWLYATFLPKKESDILQPDKVLNSVIARLKHNFGARAQVGKLYGTIVLNVLQPVPGYGTGHATSKVPKHLLRLGDHINSGRGYELIEETTLQSSKYNFLDLKSLSLSGPMYIDTLHYSPEFNQKIAMEIKDAIKEIQK